MYHLTISLALASFSWFLNQSVKEKIDEIGTIVGCIGGIVTAILALLALRRANKERREAVAARREATEESRQQQRWRQIETSRSVLKDLKSDPAAAAAMRMLDWSGRRYQFGEHSTGEIDWNCMRYALRAQMAAFTPDEKAVRDAFDAFFEHLGAIEHFIDTRLIVWDDMQQHLHYYAKKLADNDNAPVMFKFLTTYDYEPTLAFLRRYPEWNAAEAKL